LSFSARCAIARLIGESLKASRPVEDESNIFGLFRHALASSKNSPFPWSMRSYDHASRMINRARSLD
jgi:hypothetical protein